MQGKSKRNVASWTASSIADREVIGNVYDNKTGKKIQVSIKLKIKDISKELSVRLYSDKDNNNIYIGQTLKFTAEATGGSGDYSYEYELYNFKTQSKNILKGKDKNNTSYWKASSIAPRLVKVIVYDNKTGKSIENSISLNILENNRNEFKVNPLSLPYDENLVNNKNYNEDTKHYYLLRSYMDYFEKNGGGKLVLEAGEYNVPCTIYIPSNVDIELSQGAVLNKTSDVGNSSLTASSLLFAMIRPSYAGLNKIIDKYNGEKNINIFGDGTINITTPKSTGFYIGHSDSINVSGLTFNLFDDTSYALKLSGDRNISILNNKILGNNGGRGILIDIQSSSASNSMNWEISDNTICESLLIHGNKFEKLNYGVFSSRLMENKFQTNISVLNNKFEKIQNDAISIMNWKNPKIENNYFTDIAGGLDGSSYYYGIKISGVISPLIKNNKFQEMINPIYIGFSKALDSNNETKNIISTEEILNITDENTYKNIFNYYIKRKDSSEAKTILYYIKNDSIKEFKLSPNDLPYRNKYMNNSDYSETTRQSYAIQSYLDLLSSNGGGTLTLEKGDWNLFRTIYVPSNITIKFEENINLIKKDGNSVIFSLIEKNKVDNKDIVNKYSGENNIKFIGIDNVNINVIKDNVTVFLLGHNRNIEIDNININLDCKNSFGINIIGSKNINIRNVDVTGSNSGYGISIEVPEKSIEGQGWIGTDNTPCEDININRSSFNKLDLGVYSNDFTDNVYNSRVNIQESNFSNINLDAIKITNWKDAIIKSNDFTLIGKGFENNEMSNVAIRLRGAINPIIEMNNISKVEKVFDIGYLVKESDSTIITQNSITDENIDKMISNSIDNVNCYYFIRKDNPTMNEIHYYFPDENRDYIVYPNSKPYRNYYISYKEEERNYYTLRSYLEQIERNGKGSITLKSGVYNISDSLSVPSNTKIYFEDGVTINFTGKEGSVFILVNKKDLQNNIKYYGYEGTKNIEFIGPEKGTAIIDMNEIYGTAISIAHTQDVSVKNLEFRNMNGLTHFIELDASKNTIITGNKFIGSSDKTKQKEAINLDTPDKLTGGYESDFTSYDKTANESILIENNIFKDIPVAVGTHMYSDNSPHNNIMIENNTMVNCNFAGINMMNWSNPTVTGNTIYMEDANNSALAINMNGVKNPTIKDNIFKSLAGNMNIQPVRYDNSYSSELQSYSPIYNEISEENKMNLFTNVTENLQDDIIYYSNDFSGNYEKWYDLNENNFTINKNTKPYKNKYINNESYNEFTKDYYVLRSYLEHLEVTGGGIIELEAGNYYISNTLIIPENTTFKLNRNARIIKTNYTGSNELMPSSTLFSIKSESSDIEKVNIRIEGEGILDLNNIKDSAAIVINQVQGIDINGISFEGINNRGYIILNSAKEINILNCSFNSNNASLGYGISFTSLYNIGCRNINVSGNKFDNMYLAVTTMEDKSGVWQENINIYDNNFNNIRHRAINGSGLKHLIVKNNNISNMPDSKRAIYLYGVISPEISNNVFKALDKPITINVNSAWNINVIDDDLKELMINTNTFEDVKSPYIEFFKEIGSEIEIWRP